MAAADFITLAFLSALRSYQQDHQQEPTYSLADWQELEVQHAKDLLEHQQHTMQEVPEAGSIAVSGAEHQQGICETLIQAEESELGTQQTTGVPSSEQSNLYLPQMATAVPHAAEEAQQSSGSHNQIRNRYTREQMLQLQPQQPTAQHSNIAAAAANGPATVSATKIANNSFEQQSQQHNEQYQQQQQQQQQQWHSQYYWNPYSYWDGTSWTTPASPAAAPAPGGWNWGSSGDQQHSNDAQQQQQQQTLSALPAVPPLPPANPHYCGTAGDQPQACTVCGKTINTPAASAIPSVRDQRAVRSALMSQIPRDIAHIPESLAAAEAAIVKTVALSQTAECRNSMPELMMAWFYAGYHAGKLSSGRPGSSSSSRAAGHEPSPVVKSAGAV